MGLRLITILLPQTQPSVLVTLFLAATEYLTRSRFQRENGFIFAHSLRAQFVRVGKIWPEEPEAAGSHLDE